MAEPTTIAEEIEASICLENYLGAGVERAVFRFQDERLQDYVFAINAPFLFIGLTRERTVEAALKNFKLDHAEKDEDLLKPVDHFLDNRNFGHSLLEGAGITIMSAIHGKTLEAAKKSFLNVEENDPWWGSEENVCHALSKFPHESFVQLFDDVAFVHEHGFEVDSNLGNFILDLSKQRISLIDLRDFRELEKLEPSSNNSHRVIHTIMSVFMGEDGKIAPMALTDAQATFDKLLDAAVEAGLHPHPEARSYTAFQNMLDALELSPEDQEKAYERLGKGQREIIPSFRPKARIERIEAVDLTQPVEEMITTLNEVREHHETGFGR